MEPHAPSEAANGLEAFEPSRDTLSELDIREHMELMQEYRAAIQEVATRCENLGKNARLHMQHNPVHGVTSRLKSPTGFSEKLRRKGLAPTTQNIRAHIHDVAGVRVVCNYLDDVYAVAQALLEQDDITLISRKDYVLEPKESGYRSLHLVISVPVTLDNVVREVPVEVQIRTIAMDFWASLEHQLRYKNRAVLETNGPQVERIRTRLETCARQIAELDQAMQQIQEDIDKLPPDQDDSGL